MKNGMNKFKSNALASALVLAIGVISASCTSGGGVTSSSSSSGNGTSGSLSMTSIYPTVVGPSWTPITDSATPPRYYLKGNGSGVGITMSGVCSATVATVLVNEGSSPAYSDTGVCDLGGSWTYTHTYPNPVNMLNKTLTIQGYDVDNNPVNGATSTVLVYVSNIGPNPPTVTSPASTPYVDPITNPPNPFFNVTGTCDPSVAYIMVGSTKVTPSGTNWTYNANLSAGGNIQYNFYAYDLAGNPSATPTLQEIDYNALTLVFGVFGGSQITDASSHYVLEASSGIVSNHSEDPIDLFTYYTGLNDIIQIMRGL